MLSSKPFYWALERKLYSSELNIFCDTDEWVRKYIHEYMHLYQCLIVFVIIRFSGILVKYLKTPTNLEMLLFKIVYSRKKAAWQGKWHLKTKLETLRNVCLEQILRLLQRVFFSNEVFVRQRIMHRETCMPVNLLNNYRISRKLCCYRKHCHMQYREPNSC